MIALPVQLSWISPVCAVGDNAISSVRHQSAVLIIPYYMAQVLYACKLDYQGKGSQEHTSSGKNAALLLRHVKHSL